MVSDTKKASLILLAIIFLLAIVLRSYQLDRVLGDDDENAMLLYFGYAPLQAIVTNYWDVNNYIFHTILVRLMGTWFGEENSIAIRLPTFLFGLAGLWMVHRIALDLFNSNLIARMALLIAAVNPVHIHYSQTARGYGLIIFFSAAMILLSLKALRSEISRSRGALITACGFLSVYTLPTNLYFLFGLSIWILDELLEGRKLNPYNPHYMGYLGQVFAIEGDYGRGLRLLKEALRFNQTHHIAKLGLSAVELQRLDR